MTALPQDAVADLSRLVAELEQRLDSSFVVYDQAIAQQAVLARENARLQSELATARDREAASAEILRTISEVSGDPEHSLQQIVETTARLFGASSVRIRLVENGTWGRTFLVGRSSEAIQTIVPTDKLQIGGPSLPGTAVGENRQIHIPDLDHIGPEMAEWPALPVARAAGARTISGTPLRRDGQAIGVLLIHRDVLLPFTEAELALQQSFADQAVIAIENARLFNETREALEQQKASASILSVISNSVANTQPVFDEILSSIEHLFDADGRFILLIGQDGLLHVGAAAGPDSGRAHALYPAPLEGSLTEIAIRERRLIAYADMLNGSDVPPAARERVRQYGQNLSMVVAPMLREDKAIGAIMVAANSMRKFSEKECDLLRTFADQAVIAIENARLFNETREALARQTATSEILKVIASSPSDVQPVFEALVNSAAKLFGPCGATITTLRDGKLYWNATGTSLPGFDFKRTKAVYPLPFDPERSPSARAILERRIIEIPDVDAPDTPDFTRQAASAGGFKSITFVPLVNQGKGIGTIILNHPQAGFRLSENQLALVQTFADQAVIAIENARLFNETQEALARQTATSDILRVISQSPTDIQPVFDAIVQSAMRLLGCDLAAVLRCDDAVFSPIAEATPEGPTANTTPRNVRIDPAANFPSRAIVEKKMLHLPDYSQIELPEHERRIQRIIGVQSALFLPLLREDDCIGVLALIGKRPRTFSENEIALARSFCDQALIAIENVRLFNETREALERQTATADILKVIASSPSDVQPVFDAIAASANRLLSGFSTTVFRFIDGQMHLKAFTPTSPAGDELLQASFPRPLAEFPTFELVRDGATAQFADTEAADVPPAMRELARSRGFRSMLFTPLISNGLTIGMIGITRPEPGGFAAHHVQLLQTFADQAVIAIENVRLFDEVQARTRELTEALTYQTGSANILQVIASSPTDVGPVLEAIVESACELCEAYDAIVFLKDGEELRSVAHCGPIPEGVGKIPIKRSWAASVAFLDRKPMHVSDMLSAEGDEFPDGQEASRRMGHRTMLSVPLLREGESVGVIMLRRNEVNSFSDRQISLLRTFADQAVIAIGNVRLFDEVQARTRDLSESLQQQTATADVLKVISRSAFDLQTVLETLTHSAVELSNAKRGAIFLRDGDVFRFKAASSDLYPEWIQFLKEHPQKAGRNSAIARAIANQQTICVPDVLEDPEIEMPATSLAGIRAVLAVPLLRDGNVEGVMVLSRPAPGPFTARQIDLVQTFADQAVIAIENVRLFDEVQARTRELAASLEELRTAQDRLVQTEKLASLGQLTAGIAHEIKNPLNFVNNFSSLSAELTDELNDVLKTADLADKVREEVDELTGLLKDNLQKVVQHGKRADSIVKNMLLHSREGSGDHRPADINALLDESLNLAYHGARAEKPQFNVTLQRNFDPNAGMIEVFPQEITRVFLNLVGNGFYAVTKRKAEAPEGFDPVVSATTKDLGDHVEIRIRDNGTGIPPEVKEKMFNPFFTTKPAGEGTGLGLSMSHDIIVKQHNGSIDVDTEPGRFTEFTVRLPRSGDISNKNK